MYRDPNVNSRSSKIAASNAVTSELHELEMWAFQQLGNEHEGSETDRAYRRGWNDFVRRLLAHVRNR